MNTPISPTPAQNARVIAVYSTDSAIHGEHPFSSTSFHAPDHAADLMAWVKEEAMDGLAEESLGGIIGYVHHNHADRIAGLLDAAASEQVRSTDAVDCLATLIQTIADIDGKMLNELMTPEFRARCEAITGPIKASPLRR